MTASESIPCPECGALVAVTLNDLRAGRTLVCPAGHTIELESLGSPGGALRRAVADLGRTLSRFTR